MQSEKSIKQRSLRIQLLQKTTTLRVTMTRNLQSSIFTKTCSNLQTICGLLLLLVKTLHSEQLIAYNSTPTRLASEVSLNHYEL